MLGAQGLVQPEGHGGFCVMGEQRCAPDGVYDYGTLEEDGPATWETLSAPCALGEGRPPARDDRSRGRRD